MRWKKLCNDDLGSYQQWRVFLFLPKCLNGDCRWLETAVIEYRIDRTMSELNYEYIYYKEPIRFVD